MSVIVARGRGIGGAGAGGIGTALSLSIPNTTTGVVDILPVATYRSAKWLVTVTDSTGNRVRSYEVFGMHRNGASPTHNQYGILGDTITHTVAVTINGTNLRLEITNNDGAAITVDAVRLPIIV